jgi:FixJ family two-component response regulator
MDAAGLKPREIAAALGISTQAVWLHRDALGLTPKAQKAKEQAS